ncbi:MAG: hypothetical protein WD178_06430 [Actinomycetota bacterium]
MAGSKNPNTTFRVSMTNLLKPEDSVAVDDSIRTHLSESRQLVHKLRDYADLVEATLADLEGHERLDNFLIQRLMSAFNQMEQLSAEVFNKRDDTGTALAANIG